MFVPCSQDSLSSVWERGGILKRSAPHPSPPFRLLLVSLLAPKNLWNRRRTSNFSHMVEFMKRSSCLNQASHWMASDNIKDLLHKYKPTLTLWSAFENNLIIPKTRLSTHSDRAFSAFATKLWNSLPFELKNANSYDNFKAALKTLLCRAAYRT